MNLLPQSKSAWGQFVLFPFKAYVVVAVPLAFLIPNNEPKHGNNESIALVLPGYLVCLGVLVVGGILQSIYGARQQGRISFAFAAAALLACVWPWFYM